jgi:Tfp pilus assembly protein PilO
MITIKNRTLKVLINIVIYSAVFSAMHFFGGMYIFRLADQERKIAEEIQAKLATAQKLVNENPNPKKSIEIIKAQMEELQERAASEKDLPKVIQQLTKKSSDLGVEILSIKPVKALPFKEIALPQGVSKAYIEMTIKSDYRSLGEYLKAMKELPTVFTIESISIEPFNEGAVEDVEAKKKKPSAAGNVIANMLISSYTVYKL